ncbi:methyltransferase [Candidatus Woesearchaeota archaeon]|nr:methyltransferase [Candidatus Woesearchaeota archaeon]
MTKYYFQTLEGGEEELLKEAQESKIQGNILGNGIVEAESTLSEATKIAYNSRILLGVYQEFSKEEVKGKTFSIESANGHGQLEVREEITEELKNLGGTLDYKSPEIKISLITINDQIMISKNVYEDLGKREYYVFRARHAIRPITANIFLKKISLPKKGVSIFPFTGDGMMAIETALILTNQSVHKTEKNKFGEYSNILESEDKKEKITETKIYVLDTDFRGINNARKNAILANTEKKIDFSRKTAEDLDLKFEDESVDTILCIPPQPSEHKDPIPQWNSLFKRGHQVLKKTGVLGVLMMRGAETFTEKAEQKRFKKEKEIKIKQGKETITGIIFRKV